MRKAIHMAVASVIGAGLLTTPIAAHADDGGTSSVAAITHAEPSALASVAPVETVADDSGSVIDQTVSGTAVTIPLDAEDPLMLSGSGSSLNIELPFSDRASLAKVDAPGIVSYDNANGTTTVPVVNIDGSVTIATVISGPQAPSAFAYALHSPGGVNLVPADGGGATVNSNDGSLIAVVAAPWAEDARGSDVPTYYEIQGDTLIQHVDLSRPDIVYPVVADPSTTFVWWGMATKLTRSETKSLAQNISSSSAGVAAFCGYIPVVPGRVACALAVAWRISSWIDPIKQAAAEGKCAQINIPWASGPVLWNVTKERC